ncbi:MAG: ADP-glyceromanno-heptose 6-epimerase [Bacteroidales bacterium]|nr:ADP-glyceromanno-heptose 6-epimerase [Bacteroidales bacterium]
MIVITGAAGFIGSAFVSFLNKERFYDLVLVDDFSNERKNKNLENKVFSVKIDRSLFIEWARRNQKYIEFIVHLGARTDTTEFDYTVFEKLNLNYSKEIWNLCVEFGIPLIYASSAATYGNGEFGFSDEDINVIYKLRPLNPYGVSKNEFDKWALSNPQKPYFWVGIKFFNVFGPNEYHKGRMASVVFHAFNQIKQTGNVKLFKSHNPNYADGEQKRDFIYVKDVCNVLFFFLNNRKNSGIYNLGSGIARSFNDLAKCIFNSLNMPINVTYIDTPIDIRDRYQYFTQADISKLRKAGFNKSFTPLEDAVHEYVTEYLMYNAYL